MGCFTKHVGKSTCLRKISTCFSGFFSGQVGARIDDIDTSKVKRYLFSIPAFFSFQVTTLVAHCGLGMLFCAPPAGRVFKNSHQNLLKKVSILSAFRLLIFNTFKVKIVL